MTATHKSRAHLHIAEGLSLPLEVVTEKLAWLGRTGSGKTYGAKKLAEEMLRAGAQIVVADPVGVWYGLRIGADGKTPGIPIYVFGGQHADVPLEPGGGSLMADVIADRGISAVLDVSQMIEPEQIRFMTDFSTRLFQRKKAAPSALHLFLEECQEFAPQNLTAGDKSGAKMLHAMQRLWKLGRNFGIGGSLISQRPQEVNKKLLNMSGTMFAFQMTGPQERDTIRRWIEEKGAELNIVDVLPRLEVGHAHVYSAWLKISREVAILPITTFNSSSTPEVGKRARSVEPLASVDLDKLREDMAGTIERAKAEDPAELRRQIAKLRAELAAAHKALPAAAAKAPAPPKRVEVLVLKDSQIAKLEALTKRMDETAHKLVDRSAAIENALRAARAAAAAPAPSVRPAVAPSRTGAAAPPARAHVRPARETRGKLEHLPTGERAILTAAAQYPQGVTRKQLSILTGYKRSSRDTYVQRLIQRGSVEIAGDYVLATAEGIGALGDFEPLPVGIALQEYWLARLPEGERKILAVLIEAAREVDRASLDELTGYKRSSRDTYIQRLSARQLVEISSGGVRASEVLFQ